MTKDEAIKKLALVVSRHKEYDFSAFEYLELNHSMVISANECVRKTPIGIVLETRLDTAYNSHIKYVDGNIYSITVENRYNSEPKLINLYIGEKKYLINDLWFDKIEFEAEAFQQDTTGQHDFSLSEMNEIFKLIGA